MLNYFTNIISVLISKLRQEDNCYPRFQSRVSLIHANVDISNSSSPGTSGIIYVEPNNSNSGTAEDKEIEYSEMKRKIM